MEMSQYYEPKDIVGKAVYDGKGRKIGEVEKVVFLKDGKGAMILRHTNKIILMEMVQGVAEIILIPPIEEKELLPPTRPSQPQVAPARQLTDVSAPRSTTQICPKCMYGNKLTASFCVKCGTKLAVQEVG